MFLLWQQADVNLYCCPFLLQVILRENPSALAMG
jgi:hypothetical protein